MAHRKPVHQRRTKFRSRRKPERTGRAPRTSSNPKRRSADTLAEALVHALETFASVRHIYFAGLRRAHAISSYFAYRMMRKVRPCSVLDLTGGMAARQSLTLQGPISCSHRIRDLWSTSCVTRIFMACAC